MTEMTLAEYMKAKREGTLPAPQAEKPKAKPKKRTKKSDED